MMALRPLDLAELSLLTLIGRGGFATGRKITRVQKAALATLCARKLAAITPGKFFFMLTDAGRDELARQRELA
jgi:hypothetical protein